VRSLRRLHSDEVRRFVVDTRSTWIVSTPRRRLRLDAVHAIFDSSARHVLDELATAVHDLGASSAAACS